MSRASERRKAAKQREKEEAKRQDLLDKKRERELEKQKDEERRQESIRESEDMEAQLEMQKAKRELVQARSREKKKRERTAAAKQLAHRSALFDAMRRMNEQEKREVAAENGRAEARRRQSVDEKHANEKADAKVADAQRKRTAEQRANVQKARHEEQRVEERQADTRRERRAEEHVTQRDEARARQAAVKGPRTRVPTGELSGGLSWLRVNGNRIADLDGRPVLLRGLGLIGLDDAPPDADGSFAAGACLTATDIDAVLDGGANVLRVSINRSRVLQGLGDASSWDYIADLDRIISRAASRGAYTILSLRRLDETSVFGTIERAGGDPIVNRIAPQPDYDTVGMWRVLAERYAAEPAVLFDLYTAPHTALPDDLSGLETSWDLWALWVRMMVAEMRTAHPRALCIVAGIDWGTDLSGFPVIGTGGEPVPNLIYGARLFRDGRSPWEVMTTLARVAPVLVTEWGGGPLDAVWASQVASRLQAMGIGWIAAYWNGPTVEGVPPLSTSAFGASVKRALAIDGTRSELAGVTVPKILQGTKR